MTDRTKSFWLDLPLAGGTLTVWIYRLKVLSILLMFHLQRSPRNQGRAKSLREKEAETHSKCILDVD